MPTTLDQGVDDTSSMSVDDAANALLSRWTDAPKPSIDEEGATPIRRSETEREPDEDENSSEDEDLDLEDESTQEEQTNEPDAAVEASDDALVKLTVDGEEIKIPVKDLKRLYGQEASLTRKSQEVAERRKFADEEATRYVVATQRLIDKAKERFSPYAQVDWAIAAKTLGDAEYVALRQEAQAAFTEMRFFENELQGVVAETNAAREAAAMEEAKAALDVLQRDIPNFNADTYRDMAQFATSVGIPEQTFVQLTDPAALKIVHMAMSYQRAKERAASKRKAAPTSKRTMTTNRRTDTRANLAGDALKRLKQTGSRDDAVSALLERWNTADD